MKKVITVIMVVLALTECAKATLVNSNSIIQDGIEYYLQTDKFVYNLGEDVEMLFRVTNLRDEDVLIGCSRKGEFNLWVQKDSETIWARSHWFAWFSPGVELSAGESIDVSHIWNMVDDTGSLIEPGDYSIVGVMYNEPWNYYYNHRGYIITHVGVPMSIIPEPGSLSLFIVGIPILKHIVSKKMRLTTSKS